MVNAVSHAPSEHRQGLGALAQNRLVGGGDTDEPEEEEEDAGEGGFGGVEVSALRCDDVRRFMYICDACGGV